MKAKEILSDLAKIADQPYEKAKEWKQQTGGKVLGLYPMHFPEELIHASGVLPILLQQNDEPVTEGHAYYYPFFCGLARSIVDQASKNYLNFLDGTMSGEYCVQEVGAGEVTTVLMPNAHSMFFRLPVCNYNWTIADIVDSLREIKQDLETFTGKEIKEESIWNSIRIYNRNRSLIRKIYEMREENPGILSSKDMVTIVKTSMIMPKEEHSAMLEELIPELAKRQANTEGKIRIWLSGALCGAPKLDILQIFEQAGAVVVGDDLFHGYRYISTDIEESGDPLTAIATFYVKQNQKVPCPTRIDQDTDWGQYLIDSVKKVNADQIVILMAKYCEPHMFFYPDIAEVLNEAGIDHLLIEMEHEVVSLEALRTRIEAFVEIGEAKALSRG